MNRIIYSVSFKNDNKPVGYVTELDLKINDEVIVETERGLQYGKITQIEEIDTVLEYSSIIRKATEEDEKTYFTNLKDADIAYRKSKELVSELGLSMSVINAEYNFDRSQLVINFCAEERIDFRELAKKLAGIYHTRIELRQIGARDKAKKVGGVGICGQNLCCNRFLNQIDSISMNRAKNQNLTLNPSKINGLCGRLLCCLCYEDEEYSRCKKGLLNVGKMVKVNGEDAKIISVDILTRTYTVVVGEEKIKVKADELDDSKK